MARYSPPPDGYRPWLKLQLRASVEGGDLLAAVRQIPPLDPAARRAAVVLVHGFNNHEGEAGAAYYGFRSRQYVRAPTLVPPGLERLLADVFWPGDAAWGLFDLVDFLVYPAAVATARDAAPRLASHLRSMPSLVAAHFVGHSLGCRVVLETIDDLARNGGPHVGKVCLMAAAVPVFKVQAQAALAGAMEHADEVRILHSEDDPVLRYTFAPGQTLASGDEGFFPTALGRHGPPPGVPGRLDPIRVGGAGHGDYWGHAQTSPAARAADRIAQFFQFGSWARRVGEPSPGATSREAAADRREIGRARVL